MLTREIFSSLPGSLRARRELRPLLYCVAKESGLRDAYLAALARNLRLLDRAAQILDGAEARGLRLLPLKGAVMAGALYPDPGARPMLDVDLLVHPEDFEGAIALAGELGFRRAYPERERYTARHAHDVSFVDEKNLSIELHWRLWHELAADGSAEPLFARAIEIEIFGKPRRVPSWDDQLFATAVHAATHAFGDSPLWIFDLAFLIERGANVDAAALEAERRRAGFAFRASLALAEKILPSLIPKISRPLADRLREKLLTLVLGRDRLAAPPRRLPSLLARALLTDDPRDAAREIFRKAALRGSELRTRQTAR